MIHRKTLLAIFYVTTLVAGCKEEQTIPIDMAAAERGEALAEDCKGCHALTQNSNKIGPHLVRVFEREIASVSGYEYSESLTAQEGEWTAKRLIKFILDPTVVVPGTKMAFGGINAEEASDIVEFLKLQAK